MFATGFRSSTAVLLVLSVVLVGCSATKPAPAPAAGSPTTASPSSDRGTVVAALSRYAASPCALLGEEELAAYGIDLPPRQIDLSEGPATSCYWVVKTGIQLGFIPYPSAEARKNNATKPTTRRLEVGGFPVVQGSDVESCYQNIDLGSPSDSVVGPNTFSTLIVRHESNAPKDTCGIATEFTEVILSKLQNLATPTTK